MKHSAFYRPYLPLIRWPERLWKSVAWLVIVCFTVNCVTPAVVAAKTLARDAKLYAAPVKTEFDQASDALIALEETLDRMDRRLSGKFEFAWQETLAQTTHATPPAAIARADVATLESVLTTNLVTLDAQQATIQGFFAQTQADLKTHSAASAIQSRAQAQGTQYEQMYAQLKSLLAAIPAATTDTDYKAAVAAATTFLHSHSSKPKRAKFDPNHLAFGPPKERARQALSDAATLRQALQLPDPNGSSQAKTKTAASALARVPAAMPTKPSGKTSTTAQPKDLPANLAATEDVQITPAIQAKAASLNNNALKIYQFVRNSVEYLPTYGSIQGSDYTLQTLRGNDIDQASLLIGLLRAANIPAHYVYGTVRVPIAQVENWVGGVTDPNAALDLMSQGGIPTLGLAQGGVIKYAQIEHVWVEAQIRFSPSRGAVTTSGTTWVPLDPSFKQYAYTQGMNLQTAVPFDAQTFANTIQSTSTINTSQGWVQNVDQNYINTQLTNYQTQVQNYVNGQSPNATVGDVIGTKTIQAETLPILMGTLPYATVTTASKMDALPDTLRWAFHYSVDGQTLLSQSLPSLAGHLLALSFDPATPQDEATLESYIPKNITDPSQLPTSLPAGVVKLKAQFSIDGQTIATGPAYALGDQMTITKGLYQPNGGWQDGDKTFAAGDYQAVALAAAGLSSGEAVALQSRLQVTQAQFQTKNFGGVTKHDLTGAALQAAALRYFLQTFGNSEIAAKQARIVLYPLPSFGTVSTNSDVELFFGIPVKLSPNAVLTDMDRIATESVSILNDSSVWKLFNQANGGMASRFESSVLEESFSIAEQPASGISAVQALTIADEQDQRIYIVDETNASALLPQLQLTPEVMSDVASAANAGQLVTLSTTTINYAGQATMGYVILDPATGGGAYKIASGADGGGVKFAQGVMTALSLILFFVGTAGVAPILLVIVAILAIFLAFYSILQNANEILEEGGACAVPLSELYIAFAGVVSVIATALGVKSNSLNGLLRNLVLTMYGSNLFKSVVGTKACG